MKKYSSLILFLLVAATSIGLFAFYNKKEKTAYVDISKLYNDFQLKKELETKLIKVQQARKNMLDSLRLQLEFLSGNINSDRTITGDAKQKQVQEFESRKMHYYQMEKSFSEDNEKFSSEYKEQILIQFNPYVNNYGKENGYEFIYGTDGTGAVMYASESKNITDKVVKYVDEQYKGSSK